MLDKPFYVPVYFSLQLLCCEAPEKLCGSKKLEWTMTEFWGELIL